MDNDLDSLQSDLASLLGSLDIQLKTPSKQETPASLLASLTSSAATLPPSRLSQSASAATSAKAAAAVSTTRDKLDATVLHFGTECSLRGRLGKYLCAVPQNDVCEESAMFETNSKHVNFSLGVEGQGVGDPLDSLVFIKAERREDDGPICYGNVVSLRAPAAKERLLGVRDGTKLGFWRSLMGQGEKWTVMKGVPGRGVEEVNTSLGTYVRQGDMIVLQAGAEFILSLHEGAEGVDARLVHKDRASLDAEHWQVDLSGAQPLPPWASRPFLSRRFLVNISSSSTTRADVEARAFLVPSASFPLPPPILLSLASSSSGSGTAPFQSLAPSCQNIVIVREVLLALTGVEGQFIRVASGPNDHLGRPTAPHLRSLKFAIDGEVVGRAIATQVSKILPMCEDAVIVREFMRLHTKHSYGLVSHALSAAIKGVLREFDVLVALLEVQMKQGDLSLQRIDFLLQPAKATLHLLSSLAERLWDKAGGQLLDELHICLLEQGDVKASEVCLFLLQKASQPFLVMLSRWIFKGELEDPYHEFMIQEDLTVSRDALADDFNAQYWEGRYKLREKHTPRLMKSFAIRALTAGKYLNVVRGCFQSGLDGGLVVASSSAATTASTLLPLQLPQQEQKLVLDSKGTANSIAGLVEKAYVLSSRALLRLLEEGHGLSSHLKSLSRFFLLEHGDFFIQFMDTAEEELRREAKDVAVPRVQGLLQLALQTSTLSQDPHREDLSCALASHNLIQHLHLIQHAGTMEGGSEAYASLSSQGLKGVEALTLDYRVGWPISLLLSRRAITKYQLLSRLLYFSKHVELRVLGSWQDHQSTKELNVRAAMGQGYCLRHRMLHFLQNFVYYMTLEVIGPRQHEMTERMKEAQDMDEVLHLHESFLDTCLKECLLASQDLLKNLTKIMTTCLLFADQMRRFAVNSVVVGLNSSTPTSSSASTSTTVEGGSSNDNHHQRASRRKARLDSQTTYVCRETAHESFQRMLAKFADTFDSQLREFLERLWTDSYRHHPQLANLCTRLDYNNYYTGQFS